VVEQGRIIKKEAYLVLTYFLALRQFQADFSSPAAVRNDGSKSFNHPGSARGTLATALLLQNKEGNYLP
jgi:hypothetical protein